MAQKRPDPQLRSPFADAVVKKGPPIEYTSGSVKAGSENRGGKSQGNF
jgi:hypothetical protein